MVSLTCTTDRRNGVTLVTAQLSGATVDQRVRLRNRLDGPVWPPRRHGVTEQGWDEGCYETVVPADETVALGYASPTPPTDDPLTIVEQATVEDTAGRDDVTSPADALRKLGDPSPPREAVPIPTSDDSDGAAHAGGYNKLKNFDPPWGRISLRTYSHQYQSGQVACTTQDRTGDRQPKQDRDGLGQPKQAPARNSERPRPRSDRLSSCRPPDQGPTVVHGWLDAVEDRVETAERLAAADTVPEATEAVREAGSLADAAALVERLDREGEALDRLASRADRLAERTAETDVPLATFERLA